MDRPDLFILGNSDFAIALCDTAVSETGEISIALAFTAGSQDWVQLFPLGNVAARDGRKWKVTDPQAIVAKSLQASIDLVVDYEHQTDYSKGNGRPAPAAGWIKELEVRPDGIWARVEWTSTAKRHLDEKEYRYISPTFLFDKKTLEVRQILRAGLTNAPAMDLKALAKLNHEDLMNDFLKALLKLLGLPEDTEADAALAKLSELLNGTTALTTRITAACKALGLDESADEEAVKTAIAKLSDTDSDDDDDEGQDNTKFVSVEDHNKVVEQLAKFQGERTEEKATAAVDDAIREGKLTPAQRDWAVGFATENAESFAKFVESQPVIVKPGTQTPNKAPARNGGELDDDEKAACKILGIAAEDFKKTRDAQAEASA